MKRGILPVRKLRSSSVSARFMTLPHRPQYRTPTGWMTQHLEHTNFARVEDGLASGRAICSPFQVLVFWPPPGNLFGAKPKFQSFPEVPSELDDVLLDWDDDDPSVS